MARGRRGFLSSATRDGLPCFRNFQVGFGDFFCTTFGVFGRPTDDPQLCTINKLNIHRCIQIQCQSQTHFSHEPSRPRADQTQHDVVGLTRLTSRILVSANFPMTPSNRISYATVRLWWIWIRSGASPVSALRNTSKWANRAESHTRMQRSERIMMMQSDI